MVRTVAAAVVTCAVGLAAGACGANDRSDLHSGDTAPVASAGPPAAPPTSAPGFDYSEPESVCEAFAKAILAHDATTDAGPQDAYRRASAYMVEPLPATEQTRGDARWAELVAHRARIEVEVREWAGELPADHPTTAFRAVLATTRPVGSDGWRGEEQRYAVYCSLYRSDPGQASPGWRVAEYTIEYLGESGDA